MHSLRLYTSRRLALLLLIGIPVITLVSVGHILSVQPDGVKILKRDGSTITFTLPWNSAMTSPTTKSTSPLANGYMDGITNFAEALTKGGILMGESSVNAGSNILSIVVKAADGSLTTIQNNPVNTAVGQGDLVNAGIGFVSQVLSTATSPSNVGALNTTKPTVVAVSGHSDGCGCSACGCTHSAPTPLFVNSTSGNAKVTSQPSLAPTSSMMMPMTACGSIPTITETWHSTHYAETATLYSFMSIMTVTCTETMSLYPSSSYLASNNMTLPPQPTGMIQCMNGVFVQRKEDCPTTMMNNSTMPGSSSSPCYSCSQCSTGLFCPPQTTPQPCPCGAGWPCVECSGGWFCPPASTSAPTRNNSTVPGSSSSSPCYSCSQCSTGLFCPPQIAPQPCPCGGGWLCVECGGGWFCPPAPTSAPTGSNGPASSNSSVLVSAMSITSMRPSTASTTTNLASPTLSANGMTSASANNTQGVAQPTSLGYITASTFPSVTSSPGQPPISRNVTFSNSTSSIVLPTTLPSNTLVSSINSTIGNVTSLSAPQASSPLNSNGTIDLFSTGSALLAANTSVLLPTQIVVQITTSLTPSSTGIVSTASLPVNSTLLGSIPSVSLSLTTPPLLTAAPSLPSNPVLTQVTDINVSDYGSRVRQGVESGVKGALSNINGLTGSLLSTILAEVNSVLSAAIQTAATGPISADAIVSNPPTSAVDSLIASILPVASQAISNAVSAGGAAVASQLSVANSLLENVLPTLPTASSIVNNVVVNVPAAAAAVITPAVVGAEGNTLPVVTPFGNNVVGIAAGVLGAANGVPRIIPA